jgi:hypothetical protein
LSRDDDNDNDDQNTTTTTTTIRDYIETAVTGRLYRWYLSILSWNNSTNTTNTNTNNSSSSSSSSGGGGMLLDTNVLYDQTPMSISKFPNLMRTTTSTKTNSNSTTTNSNAYHHHHPHGVVALLATTDHNAYSQINWEIPSPIPIIAYSVPIQAFPNTTTTTNNHSWVYVVPTPHEMSSSDKNGGRIGMVQDAMRYASRIPFDRRTPIMMYRGLRAMNVRQRGKVFRLGATKNNNNNNSNTHYWLNATQEPIGNSGHGTV